MLNFLFKGKLGKDVQKPDLSPSHDELFSREREMSLKYTEAAIDLIEGKGGSAYRTGIAKLLQKPSIRAMVAPEYRLRLEKILTERKS